MEKALLKIIQESDLCGKMIAEDLLWHLENPIEQDKKLRKALKRVAMYYMTYEQCVSYFGEEETNDVWFP
jgi:hypothetical protein